MTMLDVVSQENNTSTTTNHVEVEPTRGGLSVRPSPDLREAVAISLHPNTYAATATSFPE